VSDILSLRSWTTVFNSQLRIICVDFRDRNAVTLSEAVAGDVKLPDDLGIVDCSLSLSEDSAVILIRVYQRTLFGVVDHRKPSEECTVLRPLNLPENLVRTHDSYKLRS
jgi:hypothetical protein